MVGIPRAESLSIYSPYLACTGSGRVDANQRLSIYNSRRVAGTGVYTWTLDPSTGNILLGTGFWFSKPREEGSWHIL